MIKFNAGKLPNIPDIDVEMATNKYLESYPEHAELIHKVMKGAIMLREICLENYDVGGHRLYETTELFHWYESQCYSYCGESYPQTQGSFAFYILNHKTIAKAAKSMIKDLASFNDYASDIEDTIF